MKLSDREIRITGVRMGDFSVSMAGEEPVLEGVCGLIAVVNTVTGERITAFPIPLAAEAKVMAAGSFHTYNEWWSIETRKHLNNLIDSMEQDLLSVIFKEDQHVSTHRIEAVTDEEAPQV
jgi:hypothetical protein